MRIAGLLSFQKQFVASQWFGNDLANFVEEGAKDAVGSVSGAAGALVGSVAGGLSPVPGGSVAGALIGAHVGAGVKGPASSGLSPIAAPPAPTPSDPTVSQAMAGAANKEDEESNAHGMAANMLTARSQDAGGFASLYGSGNIARNVLLGS